MSRFHHLALEQFTDQQVNYAPPAHRREQWERAVKLLAEIDAERVYPFEYVCFRITGHRGDARSHLVLSGRSLQDDLRLVIDRLDRSLPAEPRGHGPESVLTLVEIAERYSVSTKTVRRWKISHRLVGKRVLINGKRCLGFAPEEIERFASTHAGIIQRGTRFSRLSSAEVDLIVRRARRLARAGASLMETSRRLARRLGRSIETVRSALRRFDRTHPGHELFPNDLGPLRSDHKHRIFDLHRRGIPMVAIAREYNVARNTGHKAVREVRAERLVLQPVDFIDHESFRDADKIEAILGPMPESEAFEAKRASLRAPRDVPPELAPLYEVPLLSKDQEQHLFRQMNYLKFALKQACDKLKKADGSIDSEKVRSSDLDQIEKLQSEVNTIKDLLISCNMRLVVSIAKRHSGQTDNFFELLSDGNMSLMRAVEKFDFSRGNKFSTYASWAIMKNFARSIPEERNRKERYITGHEDVFDAAPDNRTDEAELLSSAEQAAFRVNRMLEFLDPREREIIRMRAGLDHSEGMTLEQIGQRLGITKERVRQLNVRIMKKLRDMAEKEKGLN